MIIAKIYIFAHGKFNLIRFTEGEVDEIIYENKVFSKKADKSKLFYFYFRCMMDLSVQSELFEKHFIT